MRSKHVSAIHGVSPTSLGHQVVVFLTVFSMVMFNMLVPGSQLVQAKALNTPALQQSDTDKSDSDAISSNSVFLPFISANPSAAIEVVRGNGSESKTLILVKFKASASAADIHAAIQASSGKQMREFTQIRTRVIEVATAAADRIATAFAKHSAVERTTMAVVFSKAGDPNDPDYAQQWALPKISWDQAYTNVAINGSATIAVLDTGVDASHPDLSTHMVAGNSFVGGDANTDPNGHGTALAGIAAASVNNSTGIAGVAFAGASVSSVQVLGSDGLGSDADVVAGVLWAADNGADVILMGFRSADYSAVLADALAYAWTQGVVLVAATGNDGTSTPTYPAGMPNVLGVAVTDANDNLAVSSNMGSAVVAAPGVDIHTTATGDGYGNVSGTSAASAHVAGLAALLVADGRSNSAIYDQIRSATDPVNGQSFGRINVMSALGAQITPPTATPTAEASPTPGATPTYEAAATITLSPATGNVGTTVSVSSSGGSPKFGASTLIIVTFNGTVVSTSPTPCTTNNGGNFICSFVVPTVAGGTYIVVATDGTLSVSASFTVTGGKLNQTITFNALIGKTYGDAPFTVSASANSGLLVSFSVTGNCTISGTTVTITGAGSCTVTASQAGNATYNAAPNVIRSFTIAKATATISISNLSHTYDGLAKSATVATTPAGLNILNVTYNGLSTAPINAGSYTILATLTNPNYQASDATATLVIAKANQSITFAAMADKVYGNADVAVSASATSGLGVSFSASGNCLVSGDIVQITGAGSCMITASQAGDGNYNAATSVARSFTINKATATISLSNLSHVYDGSAKAATATTVPAGLTVLTISYSQAGNPVTSPTNAGDYDVVANLTNANYAAANATGVLHIAKADQTITFGTISAKTYLDPSFTIAATASSGLAVSFSAAGSCSVSGDTVTITGAGSCEITATQTGNDNYNAAPPVPQSFSIAKANQSIIFASFNNATYGDANFTTDPTASSGLAVAVVASGACTLDSAIAPAQVQITGAGVCTITASQAGNVNYNAALSVERNFSVDKADQTITFAALNNKTYLDADFTVNASASSGLAVSFTAVGDCTVTGNTVHITGAGDCEIKASQTGDDNYNPADDVSQSFMIAQASQTITFDPLAGKTFGDSSFTVNATASSGLAVSFSVTGNCTIAGNTVEITGAGSCTVTAAQSGDSNYLAALDVAQNFTIAKTAATLTLSNLSQTYDGTPKSATVTSSPADLTVIAVTYDGSPTAPTNAGSYAVAASLTNADYQASNATGTLVIAKAGQNINFAPLPDRTFGDASFTVMASASSMLAVTFSVEGNCSIIDDTVTITGAGSCTVTAHQAGNNNYNAAIDVEQSFTIAKAAQSITFEAIADTTFGVGAFVIYATSTSGLPVGLSVGGPCTLDAATAPTAVNITGAGICTITAAQPGDDNYFAAENVVRSFEILKANQTIDFDALDNKTFLDADFVVNATASSRLAVSFTALGDCTVTTNIVHITGAGSCTLTASQVGNVNYNPAADKIQTFLIAKANQTISFDALASKTYGDAPFTVSAAASSSLAVSFGAMDNCTITGNTVTITGAGSCTITASQSGDDNYHAAPSVSQSFDIDKAAATISLSNLIHTYDATAKAATATTNPVGLSGVTITYDGSTTPPTNAGSYAVLAWLDNANYQASDATGTLIINQKPASVTPNPASKTFGGTDPGLPGVLAGFVVSDGVSATYSRAAGESVAGSPYVISAVLAPSAVLANYDIIYNTAFFSINKKAASVTPNAANKTYGDADPTFTGTLLGFLPEDSVTASYSRTAGETVLDSPYVISAELAPSAALANYDITYNTAFFSINKKAASVTPDAASKTYGDADPSFTGTLGGFLADDNVTASYSRTSGETVTDSPYVISAVLAPAGVLSNYQITYNTANFTIGKKTASVTPNAANKTYGDADPSLTGTLVGFLAADGVSASYSRAAGETVLDSPYLISAVLAPVGVLSNYDITYNTANFTINKKAASVTPNAASKTYGAADPSLTGTLVGFLAADGVTTSYSRTAGETVLGSPYLIGAVLAPVGVLSNYQITYNTANFTIGKATLTVTANNQSRQYSDPNPTLTYQIGGFVNGDTMAVVTGIPTCSTAPSTSAPGTYPIICAIGTLTVLNYGFTFVNGTLTVSKEDARVTYTGPYYVSTASATATSVVVPLKATIQDATALLNSDPKYDVSAGDIRTATVTFWVNGTVPTGCLNIPVTLVNSADTKTGTAGCNYTATGVTDGGLNLDIVIEVGNYYQNDGVGDTKVSVEVALGGGANFITGGGWLAVTNSTGQYPAAAGSKMNFGFNVKYNKAKTNLQGHVNIIYRSGGRVYQIKSNAISSLTVNFLGTIGKPPANATFISKANLTDVTNPLAPVALGGGYTLQMAMLDNGEPGATDTISFELTNSGAVVFSSNWDGVKTAQKVLSGGNVVAR